MVEQARKDGYVTTMLNRRRYLPEIRSRNYNRRTFAERTAMNTPIQGSAADIIKTAMVRLHREIKRRRVKSRMLLQVHDELIFEVPEEELEEMKNLVQDRDGTGGSAVRAPEGGHSHGTNLVRSGVMGGIALPELPEVETVKRTLQRLIIGKTVEDVDVFLPKIIKEPSDVNLFVGAAQGAEGDGPWPEGQVSQDFDPWVPASHMRMEGRYRLLPREEPLESTPTSCSALRTEPI